jgi:RNA polymerase sigma-70 factor (ECF subfamily)
VNVTTLRLEPPANEPSDHELITATIAGDEPAFGLLVERFQKKIFRIAFAIVHDEMEADLVTQDTFVQAYMHLAQFESRSSLETWLTRIAINRSRDSLRARKWTRLPGADEKQSFEVVDESPDAEREAISREMYEAIERAVDSLSGQQKMIFRLRHYEQLSLEEIASSLGLRAGTVRAHLFRAVHKVRHELSGWLDQNPSRGVTK